MALALNHYSIRTTNLDACRAFYENVLGLTVGPRPEFPFPGLWMYCGDHAQYANAVVHIIGIDRQAPGGLDGYLGGRDEKALSGTGVDRPRRLLRRRPGRHAGSTSNGWASGAASGSCPASACTSFSSTTLTAWWSS